MAFGEEQTKELEKDDVLQQEGVVPRSLTACSQYEHSAGIQFLKEVKLGVSACIASQVSGEADLCISSVGDDHSRADDVFKDALSIEHQFCSLESKPSRIKVLKSENLSGRNCRKNHSWFFMKCLSIILCGSLVDASADGFCGLTSVILDCKVPPGGHARCFDRKSPIAKDGKLKTNDSSISLIENENLKMSITNVAQLRNLRCEISPATDYVREFPLKDLHQLCCVELPLKNNSHAVLEMGYNSYVMYFNITNCHDTVRISTAEKVKMEVAGSSYCKVRSLTQCDANPGKSRAKAMKPDVRWIVLFSGVVLLFHTICG